VHILELSIAGGSHLVLERIMLCGLCPFPLPADGNKNSVLFCYPDSRLLAQQELDVGHRLEPGNVGKSRSED
jgi:hypothetical protein